MQVFLLLAVNRRAASGLAARSTLLNDTALDARTDRSVVVVFWPLVVSSAADAAAAVAVRDAGREREETFHRRAANSPITKQQNSMAML